MPRYTTGGGTGGDTLPTQTGNAGKFLKTDGTNTSWDGIDESDITLADNTTNDVTTTQHGFVPKAPNVTTQFLRGDGTWGTPAGGGETKVWVSQQEALMMTAGGSSQGNNSDIPYRTLEDAATRAMTFPCLVPGGAQDISSIVVLYFNDVAGTKDLYLKFRVSSIDVDGVPVAAVQDATDTATAYATGGTQNRWETITVPAAAYNGITGLTNGDIITVYVERQGADALDTYNSGWQVGGIIITFA